jgi:hypothetical protein
MLFASKRGSLVKSCYLVHAYIHETRLSFSCPQPRVNSAVHLHQMPAEIPQISRVTSGIFFRNQNSWFSVSRDAQLILLIIKRGLMNEGSIAWFYEKSCTHILNALMHKQNTNKLKDLPICKGRHLRMPTADPHFYSGAGCSHAHSIAYPPTPVAHERSHVYMHSTLRRNVK